MISDVRLGTRELDNEGLTKRCPVLRQYKWPRESFHMAHNHAQLEETVSWFASSQIFWMLTIAEVVTRIA